eukprot:gene10818-10897_t
MTTQLSDHAAPMVLALPKGRILAECEPLLTATGIVPDPDYADEDSRKLRFTTNHPSLDVVRVRSFDVATFVAFGGAQIGICGSDVLMEFDYPEIYAPLDLGIGACRISVAEPAATAGMDDPSTWSRVRVATKYPNIARRHYAARGIHVDVVHLNGAMELAPGLGLTRQIVDLVATGSTLRANGLVETEVITQVSSRLIVNRTALKTRPEVIGAWIERFRTAMASTETGFDAAFETLLSDRDTAQDVHAPVAAIIADVRARGDAAVLDYTARFDRLTLAPEGMRVTKAEIDTALAAIPADLLAALDLAATRIERFHRAQLPGGKAALDQIGPAAVALAEAEGLQAHARSVAIRLGNPPNA